MTKEELKTQMINDYNYMVTSFDYMEYVSAYLGYVIDNLEDDDENLSTMADMMKEYKQNFSIQQDKMIGFSNSIDKLYNNVKVKEAEFEVDRFMAPVERIIKIAERTLNKPLETETETPETEE